MSAFVGAILTAFGGVILCDIISPTDEIEATKGGSVPIAEALVACLSGFALSAPGVGHPLEATAVSDTVY